jgi:hypothetical protein
LRPIPPATHPAGGSRFFHAIQETDFSSPARGINMKGDIEMGVRYLAISAATLMAVVATELSARADDAAPGAPAATTAAPPAATTDAPPVNVPRPSILPKTTDKTAGQSTEPMPPQASDDSARRPRRHYARHRHWRYAYWEPFPIYWPHIYHNRVYWNRIPWFTF